MVVQVRIANGAPVRSQHPALQQANHKVNARQDVLRLWLFGLNLPLVDIAIHPQIGCKPVSAHRAARFCRCGKTMQGRPFQVWNAFEADTVDPPVIFLYSNGKEHFILRQTPDQTRFFGAPTGLINFHTPDRRLR